MPRTLAALALTLALALPAAAQPGGNCAPRDRVVERLAATYGETRRSVGLSANRAVVEVFASDATGTWTITVTLPSGLTCLVAAGHAFERIDDPAADAGARDA